MLWGGRFNPIVPVDDASHAKQLAELFHVDALYAVADDSDIERFISANKHVQWPKLLGPLLVPADESFGLKAQTLLLDTAFVITRVRERGAGMPGNRFGPGTPPRWARDDALGDALLAEFGEYPDDEWGRPLEGAFEVLGRGPRQTLDPTDSLPFSFLRPLTPLALTTYRLLPHRGGFQTEGLFVGSADSFDDLVEFWNLSASGNSVRFLDSSRSARQTEMLQAYVNDLEQRLATLPPDSWERQLKVWSREHCELPSALTTSLPVTRCTVGRLTWNGLNERPRMMMTSHAVAVASIADERQRPTLTFQPNVVDLLRVGEAGQQYLVMTVKPHHTYVESAGFTFEALNVPELNEYYGRSTVFAPDSVRVGPDGLGIMTRGNRTYFALSAVPVAELIEQLFSAFGIAARPSRAGLIAKRLIHQMGGLQRCRVFKIAGVRRLIASVGPTKSFTHAYALQVIGPGFTAYEGLYIAPRDTPKLVPNDAFLFLLDRGVFRPGLEFTCPTCELDFWVLLDDARTLLNCEYCGAQFNVTTQLRDKHGWKYRRSGLFGRDNHQEGGIPVCLALQRLETSVSGSLDTTLYTTGLDISSTAGASIPTCELDFVFLAHAADGRVQLSVGEVKGGTEITESDVANVKAVADGFPRNRLDVYPTFVKTTDFTPLEIARCLDPPTTYPRRTILLSHHELEPYSLYDRFAGLPPHVHYSEKLSALANATYELYAPARTTPAEPPS